MKRAAGAVALVLFAVFLYVVYCGEVITLHATGITPVRAGPNTPIVAQTLALGDQAQVVGCEDTKSDLLIKVEVSPESAGLRGRWQGTAANDEARGRSPR